MIRYLYMETHRLHAHRGPIEGPLWPLPGGRGNNGTVRGAAGGSMLNGNYLKGRLLSLEEIHLTSSYA